MISKPWANHPLNGPRLHFFVVIIVVFGNRISLHMPDWPQTQKSADLCFLGAETKDVRHHA